MEYLTNRPESTAFSRVIPIVFLMLFILRSFGLHANIKYDYRYPKEVAPAVFADRTPFNERVWWLDTSKQNERIICSQRVGVFSEFYNESPVECTVGRPLNKTQKRFLAGVNQYATCLTDGQTILCQNPDGTVLKFDENPQPNKDKDKEEGDGQTYRRPRVRRLKET